MWRRAQWSGGYVSESDSQSEGPWLSSATFPVFRGIFWALFAFPIHVNLPSAMLSIIVTPPPVRNTGNSCRKFLLILSCFIFIQPSQGLKLRVISLEKSLSTQVCRWVMVTVNAVLS